MLDELQNSESSFIFVNFMTGLTAFFLGLVLYVVVKIDLSQKIVFSEILDFSAVEYILIASIVFFGFFIHGIRYLFFDYYITLYNAGNNSLFKKFVFYAFREGTTIEEICNQKRKDNKIKEKNKNAESPVREWIQKSDKPTFDVWKHATMINNVQPRANIYRFYYQSEVFQCLDTLFLFMFILSLLVHEYFFWICSLSKINAVALTLYTFCMLAFHRLCKGTSKALDSRFFLEIDVALKCMGNIKNDDDTQDNGEEI